MIILSEIANELQRILNGTDTDNQSQIGGFQNPTGFQFAVATQGFRLDSIIRNERNFIPVFVSSMGGTITPIPDVQEMTASIPLTFYFPVRFKEDMFALNQFLADCLVGRVLKWGNVTGRALSNISVAQYGEIQGVDAKQLKQWVDSVYNATIDASEPYISMQVTLYLSSMAQGYIYGNEADVTLEYGGRTDKPTFASSSIQSQTQSQAQQLLGSDEASSIPTTTAYGVSFRVYYKDNEFYRGLLSAWLSGGSQSIRMRCTVRVGSASFVRDCHVSSVVMPIEKGAPITLSISLSKAL